MLYLVLTLLIGPALAQTEPNVERLCFASEADAGRAIPILNTVLVKGQDQIQSDGVCLNLSYRPQRAEIVDRWIRTRFPEATRNFSSTSIPRQKCDMRVYKKTQRQKVQTQFGADGQMVVVGTGEQEVVAEETALLNVLSGDTASLLADQQEISITCTRRGPELYHLAFALKPIARQVPNPLTPGTPLQVPPANAQALSTSLEVAPGVEVSLGQILRDLNNKEKSISVPVEGEIKQESGTESTTWTLKVL